MAAHSHARGQMAVEAQPLLPAPTRSRKGLVAWLRGIPFVAIALVAVFAVGIGSHIARSDVAQNVSAVTSSLTQRAAGVPRWGGKSLPTLPAQDDAGAEDEDEADGAAASASDPSDTDAVQRDAAEGADAESMSSQGAQQPLDGADQASAGGADQQQPSGGDAGQQAAAEGHEANTQPATDGGDQQSSDSAQQDQPALQTAEPAPATVEEVRCANNSQRWQPLPRFSSCTT